MLDMRGAANMVIESRRVHADIYVLLHLDSVIDPSDTGWYESKHDRHQECRSYRIVEEF